MVDMSWVINWVNPISRSQGSVHLDVPSLMICLPLAFCFIKTLVFWQ